MMMPLRLQLPPRPNGASASVTTAPSSKLIFFSFPSAKKPSERPLGDQKGKLARSVPASGSAASLSSGRIQICAEALEFTATNASFVPSVFNATDPPSSPIRLSVVPSGGKTKDLLEGAPADFGSRITTTNKIIAAAEATQNSHRYLRIWGILGSLAETAVARGCEAL